MNKNGKSSALKTVLIVLLVGVLLIGVFMVAKNIQFGKPTEGTVGQCPDSTATEAWASQNALNINQPVVGISYLVKDNEGATASNGTTYGVGHKLQYIASASGYIDEILTYDVPCGGGTITSQLTEATSPAVDIFNSNNLIIDNVATNQSAIADGASATLGVRLTGVNKKTTGDLVVVIETNSSVDTITLGGADAGSAKPEFYATQVGSNSKVFTFEVPAITGAISKNYDLVLTMKNNQHYAGEVFITMYSKEAFENSDGVFTVGIEDANGVATYEDSTTANFIIN
jgi:hypothetical protein